VSHPVTAGEGEADPVGVQLMLGQLQLDRGDEAGALSWFRTAALSGDGRAVNMLGRAFERGWGVRPDAEMAARHYMKAASLGEPWAMFNLADLHCRGEGVARDDHAAYRLYLDAARRGHLKSLNMLGLFHEAGRTVAPDPEGARAFFLAAAEGGDCWGCFNLGRLLAGAGRGEEAAHWFARALETGFPDFYRAMGAALSDDPRFASFGARALALACSAGP
jgi:uncharacterized protein